jgi:hypothetical protein
VTNKYSWIGKYYVKAIEKSSGKILYEEEINNTIMNGALDEIYKSLYGDTPDVEIKYLALGTSSVSVATTQTQLVSEVFRTNYASRTTSSNQEVVTNYVVLDSEATVQIEEIGIFAGAAATTVTNSGTLVSRILWSYDKTSSNIELQFQRTDKIQRA